MYDELFDMQVKNRIAEYNLHSFFQIVINHIIKVSLIYSSKKIRNVDLAKYFYCFIT